MRLRSCFFGGAHAPRVLVSAPRRNGLLRKKFAMAEAPSPAREARALPGLRQQAYYAVVRLVIVLGIFLGHVAALADEKTAKDTTPALQTQASEPWSASLYTTTYFVPDDREYVQPTFSADRGWLHLEARYNYENFDTGSVWLGYNFSGGKKMEWAFTPMLGGVFGDTTGVAPGYKFAITWGKIEFSSEGEFVFDTRDSEGSFFYNWSELSISPVEWFRVGLVGQRTRAYQSPVDIQRGLLVGFSGKQIDVTTYVFNLDQGKPTWVVSVGVSF